MRVPISYTYILYIYMCVCSNVNVCVCVCVCVWREGSGAMGRIQVLVWGAQAGGQGGSAGYDAQH